MIQIRKQKSHLTIKGHANFGPYGQDIVCAMVTCLILTFIRSCDDKDIKYTLAEGDASISILRETVELKTRIDMLMTGLEEISEEYPEVISLGPSV